MNPEPDESVRMFQKLAMAGHGICSWTFDRDYVTVFTNCDYADALREFLLADFKANGREYAAKDHPVLLTNNIGLMWIADFAYGPEREVQYIHMLGPVHYDWISIRGNAGTMDGLNVPEEYRAQLKRGLESLPSISSAQFAEYGVMLHCAITGDTIPITSIEVLQVQSGEETKENKTGSGIPDSRDAYEAEEILLSMIENGVTDYGVQHRKLARTGIVGKTEGLPTMRLAKDEVILLVGLCSRAAIRGGLPSETAFPIGGRYIESVEKADSLSDIWRLTEDMLEDFNHRVHQVKTRSGVSLQILSCCDQIRLHITEKLTVPQLAAGLGYSANYLTQKFRKETGMSITDFIAREKTERAKILLADGTKNIGEVAASLGYSSESHFGKTFRRVTGVTPGQFREGIR